MATFDADRSVTDSNRSIAASGQKLPDSAVKSVSRARHRQSMCEGESIRSSISLRLAANFVLKSS